MPDTNTLPKPLKRKSFTAREVASVFIKYEARCAKCREKVSLGNYNIDHIIRLDALGKHELENWQLLCIPCHKPKTANDNREAKKGRRIRGENKPRVTKAIPSRPFPEMKLRRSEAPSRWQSAGFNKSLRRKMNGKVERVES
jgi:hypothetical protein